MFEHRTSPLLSRQKFYRRVGQSVGFGALIIGGSLVVGMAGYHVFEHMSWLDSFANASMILSGMGPLSPVQTNAGKLFAGCYALFSGLTFLTSIGVVFAPVFHRFLHEFHLESDGRVQSKRSQ